MAVSLLVAVVVVVLIVGVVARYLRSDPHQDVSRFHHAREITSTWSAGYQVVAEPEQPEAFEDKPELQHSVHLVEAA